MSVICLARDLIVQTGSSFRGVAASLALVAQRYDFPARTPSYSAIRWWVIRLGCYALCCVLPKDRPWVWMIDHTLQVGEIKLFVIIGCPVSDVPFGQRDLRLADLRLIALVPMTEATHETVLAELEKAIARTGVPRSIVSVGGEFQRSRCATHMETHSGLRKHRGHHARDPLPCLRRA